MTGVLVIAPAWVGDMVMTQSLLMLLKCQDGDRPVDVLAPAWTLPLADYMPEVRHRLELPLQHGELRLRERYRLGAGLRDRDYEQVIVLPNSFKSALIPFWGRIPHRTGYVGELRHWLLNDCRRLDPEKLPMTIQRFAALALPVDASMPEQLPLPAMSLDLFAGRAAAGRLGLIHNGAPVLVLCPGAEFGPAKRWPERHFSRVAGDWVGRGGRVWLLGSSKDRAICEIIAAQAGEACSNLAGRTGLKDAIELMSLAALVVSNDSGLMHVAAALQRPLVAIFGSSDPARTPPLSATARVEWLGLDCSPCFRRHCPLGHLDCLQALGPERVLETIGEIMQW